MQQLCIQKPRWIHVHRNEIKTDLTKQIGWDTTCHKTMCGHHYVKLMDPLRKHFEGTHNKQKNTWTELVMVLLPLHPLTRDNTSID